MERFDRVYVAEDKTAPRSTFLRMFRYLARSFSIKIEESTVMNLSQMTFAVHYIFMNRFVACTELRSSESIVLREAQENRFCTIQA